MRRTVVLLAALAALLPATVRAHVTMTSPTSRYPATEQKEAPCGRAGGTRTDRVTVLEPGQRVVVRWDETVDHDGHYRIAFDRDGDDDLDAPVSMDGAWITPAGVEVLADDITDRGGGGSYELEVTLPRVECERCTLQLIQVMYGSSDPYYYQCADVALRCASPGCVDEESDAGVGVDGGTSSEGGGCAIAMPGDDERWSVALLPIVIGGLLRWRRRR
ncbi:SCE4755 family polysaccharide monooxygenase-like protein [Sandaracinus amylolyticus]|uniref:SCE4755 family polysaccharide monooxygenase-like protein n=1 Tax=Sandaracinus amylolyticus TaxID=927083 RepID=UPI001F433529|nr:SCE4755 family polysaccharide monooxygenase-like protein [Sandaracinus amylolyticus]UJR81208.1 Chitin-binding type-4 domain-containing protein [Sandaracinus amylolyticus]